jgi:hypothetical protein
VDLLLGNYRGKWKRKTKDTLGLLVKILQRLGEVLDEEKQNEKNCWENEKSFFQKGVCSVYLLYLNQDEQKKIVRMDLVQGQSLNGSVEYSEEEMVNEKVRMGLTSSLVVRVFADVGSLVIFKSRSLN